MRSLLLAPGRGLAGCIFVALAFAVVGCTSTAANSGTSVSGHTLTIYVSTPPGALSSDEQDIVLAEQLALKHLGSQVGRFTVKLVQVAGKNLSDNARSAIADPTTIAYLGELLPGDSGQTLGITNAQDVLQVSPTDTALELTQSTAAVSGSPGNFYESLGTNGRTFARVVPTDRLEAKALVSEIQALGVKRLYVASDGSDYGKALRLALVSDAGSTITFVSAPTGADGVLYAGSSAGGAVQTFDQAASGNASVKLFATSALAEQSFGSSLTSAAQRDLYFSSPGFTTADLPPQGAQFVAAFKAAYGHPPATEAIFGYAAVDAVLSALQRAGGSANNHSTVAKDFLGIRNRSSVLGTYSINRNGDITFASGAPFVFSRLKGGKLVPFKAVRQQG